MLFDDTGRIIIGKGVQLKPYQLKPLRPYILSTEDEIRDNAGGTLIFDSEFYPNYTLIAFRDIKTDKIIKFELGENHDFNQQKLSWVLHSYTCVGFNSFKFDIPLLWMAFANQNTKLLHEAALKLIFENVWRDELTKEFGFKIYPTKHIDLIEVCPLRGSLKLYGARLFCKRIQELPYHPNTILDADQCNIVADYCINNDLPVTKLIYENLNEQLKLREDLSLQYNMDLMSKSDAQIAEAVIGSEIKSFTGKWPKKPKLDTSEPFYHNFNVPQNMFFQTDYMKGILNTISKARFSLDGTGRLEIPPDINGLRIRLGNSVYRMGIGGLHSSEGTRAIIANNEFDLLDVDVASYYPAIVLNLGLFPKHLGEVFLTVYGMLRDRRITAKKAEQIAISECLKVTINGTFGKTGSPFSFLYAPEMTIQITVGGQLYLLMLIEYLELNRIEVISANTDGIVIKCKKDQNDKYNQIKKEWEKITGFETEETKYRAIYSRDINAYLAIKHNNEFKGKNIFYDPWRGKTAKDGYWRFQKNPNAQICCEALEQLILNTIEPEITIKACRDFNKFLTVKNVAGGAHKDGEYLGKVIRWYHAEKIHGTINYVTSNNKVPETEGALPCMELPDQMPTNIDHRWYINKTIDMAYDLGYYHKAKQVEFF